MPGCCSHRSGCRPGCGSSCGPSDCGPRCGHTGCPSAEPESSPARCCQTSLKPKTGPRSREDHLRTQPGGEPRRRPGITVVQCMPRKRRGLGLQPLAVHPPPAARPAVCRKYLQQQPVQPPPLSTAYVAPRQSHPQCDAMVRILRGLISPPRSLHLLRCDTERPPLHAVRRADGQ